MYLPRSCSGARSSARLAAMAVAIGSLCVWSAPGRAQVDAGSAGEGSADVGISPEADAGRADGGDAETGADSRQRELEGIAERWELQEGALEASDSAEAAREEIDRAAGRLSDRLERYRERVGEMAAGLESLREQLENPAVPEEARAALRVEVAVRAARHDREAARVAGLARVVDRVREDGAVVERRLERFAGAEPSDENRDDGERRRVEEARQAEREALEQLERARQEQRQERSRELKDLIAERSTVLSKIAEVAREQSEKIQSLGMQRSSVEKSFERRREEVESSYETLPPDPAASRAKEEVDPLFEKIRDYLDQARTDYEAKLEELRAAMAKRSAAQERLAEAQQELQRARTRSERVGGSDLARRRVDLAEARLDYRRRLRDRARDIVGAHEKTLELHSERIDHWSESSERILPLISNETRRAFFSPWRSENWESVEASLREARRYVTRTTRLRLDQIRSLDRRIYSAEFWGWLFGLMWRLLAIPAVIFALQKLLARIFPPVMDALLHRPFFRRHAAGVLKLGEMARAVVVPFALFVMVGIVADYLAASFPEAEVLAWLVDLGFVYWIAMDLLKVLILPRRFRLRQSALTPSPDLGRRSDRAHLYADDVVDVVPLELEQTRRLVRTGRHVLVFVLAAWAVPELVADLLGHNVLWQFVDGLFNLAVIGIVYVELSIWRDDVAALFGDLAGSRMPRAAEFVDEHKDRVYGIAIIAVATVYVVGAEIVELGRRYLVDTELSRSIGNFIFRKKVELKQKEREEADPEEAVEQPGLPDEYLDLFESGPLCEETYLLERSDVRGPIEEHWEQWCDLGRQGSIAISGEQGVGKSTLLNQLYGEFRADERAERVAYTTPVTKIATVDRLISFVAELFDIDEPPASRDKLVERMLDQPPTVVLLDDCHHFYLRQIEGFEALSALFDLVTLTDHHHFWVLSFNEYAWRYLDRVQDRKHFFGTTFEIPAWSPEELKELVDRRNEATDYEVSYTDLVFTHEQHREAYYEVVKTANGYFRLLQDFSEGNPRVALDMWLRNLSWDGSKTLQVSLFERPSLEAFEGLTDDHLFTLTALVQHGELRPREVAEIINARPGFCQMALDFFEEAGIATVARGSGRYRLTPYYFRPVIDRLTNSNFLWS